MKWLAFAAICFAVALLAQGFHVRQKPTADELYGCTVAQQAPNGECK